MMRYPRMGLLAAVATLAIGLAAESEAALVYNLAAGPAGTNFIVQQAGNNQYYYGDDVTLTTAGPQQLNSVGLTFALYTNSGTGSYTPDLSLDIFEIDAGTRLPLSATPLATASVNNVAFAGGNFGPSTPLSFQNVTFDFTNQGLILPQNFAFAYRDNSPGSASPPGSGFSVLGTFSGSPTVGQTAEGFLAASPNDPNTLTFQFGAAGYGTAAGNLVASIDATAVPEPSTLAMGLITAAFGLGMAYRNRKAVRA